jgi:hypothetical protein
MPGVLVLALDGLAYHVAAEGLAHADLAPLRSTFPSTSATAWLTSVTGLDASEHGAVGTVYRSPGSDRVTNVLTGESQGYSTDQRARPAAFGGESASVGQPLVRIGPTIFDRARVLGAQTLALGPELAGLSGPWIRALLHGATLRGGAPPAGRAGAVAEQIVREIESVLAEPRATPLLLWAYVDLDRHIHRAGYDATLLAALRVLDEAACRWADRGWTVLAHADHGQVAVSRHDLLTERWDALDDPRYCRAPSGGAGRVRWLYPRPGYEAQLASNLRDALGGHAFVFTPDELGERGLMTVSPVIRARIGEVVAVAASPRFPVHDPSAAYEHGSITEDEVLVPFAAWNAPAAAHEAVHRPPTFAQPHPSA